MEKGADLLGDKYLFLSEPVVRLKGKPAKHFSRKRILHQLTLRAHSAYAVRNCGYCPLKTEN
jgi:hypothetical protein